MIRRLFLVPLLCLIDPASTCCGEPAFRIATFSADVTPPIGHTLFTGRWMKATGITSRLEARGFALLPSAGEKKPIVFCAVDWSEIRNDAYDRWRDALAAAAGTTRERVLVSAIHQHDTPLADLEAQRILEAAGSPHQVIDLQFHEEAVTRVARALKKSISSATPVTHIGTGRGKVDRIASNRRYVLPDGTVQYNRMSASKILAAQRAPVGDIDPYARALSFWSEDEAIAVLTVYAVHPMSYYGTGKVDADFPGLARAARQEATPATFQIYASGCSGNVTAGKFNDGRPENRAQLADRLERGMASAAETTELSPLESIDFRLEKLRLEPRDSSGFTTADLEKQIAETDDARSHGMAAIGLSWRNRADDPDHRIDVPAVRINRGEAVLLLLPGEIYIEYQLFAQDVAPDSFVVTVGYGESAPGYLPIERAWEENDSNLKGWCWVAPGMEPRVKAAIKKVLATDQGPGPKAE